MAQSAGDRNLLFGILALQMDFISRAQLVAAMQAWVLAKQKPLGQILVEGKALEPSQHALLDALVQEHLKQHDNDPHKSLAAVSSIKSVRHELQRIGDADVEATLDHVCKSRGESSSPVDSDPNATVSVGTPTSAGLRFRILRPHAKGGLGEVFVANDEELHREVALKEMQDRHADDAASRSRFLLEAEITGGLEHPGIVPVYGLGQYADGRPFYAMRFIRGDSLKEAIERFHQSIGRAKSRKADVTAGVDSHVALTPRRSPEFTSLEFRQLLGRFIDVCQAMQYAHDRGVLHRDLKPGNIMLGKYGETLVVDWGLAKAAGKLPEPEAQARESPEPPLRPASASGSAETVAGAVIGTPAYMSPEQAAGRLDQLGPASDVYSLGATLYCLLTGEPPFRGLAAGEALQQVQRGDFPRPRQLKPSAPAPLEAICLKAMVLKRDERYASPRALADDIEHWLADEPVAAWPEPVTVKLGRWTRRHKPLVSGMAAALLVGLLACTAGLLWYQHEQNRRTSQRLLAEATIQSALDQAEKPRRDLHALLAKPGGVFGLLNEPARWEAYIQTAQNSLKAAQDMLANAEAGVDPELADRAAKLRELLDRDEADRLLAEKLEKIRLDRSTIVDGKFDFRAAAEQYPDSFAKANLGIQSDPPATVAARLAAAPIKEQLLAALDDWAYVGFFLGKQGLPEKLLEIGRLAAPDPAWGDRLRQVDMWRDRRALTTLAKEAPAAGLSAPQLELMGSLLAYDNPAKIPWLRQAQGQYPADFWLNFDLGNALYKSDPAEAAGFFRVALGVRPRSSAAYSSLGGALYYQKNLPEAITAFRKAIDLDPRVAKAYNNLGTALRDQKKLREAIAAYHQAIALDPQYAAAYSNLGAVLHDQKKLPEAIAAYYKAIDLDPKYSMAYNNLGNALREQQNLPEAIAALHKAIALDRQYAPAYSNLGAALRDRQNLPEAIAAFHKAIALNPQYAPAYNNLGLTLRDQQKLSEAIVAYHQAIALDPKSALVYNNLGLALYAQKKLPEAVAAYKKAIELDPKYAQAYTNLGVSLRDQKKLPEAVAAYKKAIELDPKYVNAHGALGQGLLALGSFAEAAKASQRALELLPPSHPLRGRVQDELRQSKTLLALEKRLPMVLEGKDSAAPAELLALARMCQKYKKQHPTAVQLYEKVVQADSGLMADMAKQHRYNAACAAALAGTFVVAPSGGKGKEPPEGGTTNEAAKLPPQEKARHREQARHWLHVDLDWYRQQVKQGKSQAVLLAAERLAHWQTDPDLAGVRDAKALAALPDAERSAWTKLWADVAQLRQQIRGLITETTFQATLTDQVLGQVHEMKLEAGKTYVIDMKSTELDSYLKLHDPAGKLVAENDDIAKGNQDARIIFTPKETGVYRITATSFQEAGRGGYEIMVRQFAAKPK